MLKDLSEICPPQKQIQPAQVFLIALYMFSFIVQ